MASIPAPLLSQVSEVIADHLGLCFPKERWHDLERGIEHVARHLGFADAESCARSLLALPMTRLQITALAGYLTTGETHFFRDQRCFATLEGHLLPELIRLREGADQRIRVWSAGCCTGEEPYSIAIALHRAIRDPEGWDITVLATDINPAFLRKASDGTYTEWSFRGTPSWIKERYFERVGERGLRILPVFRRMVRFAYLNLAEDCYPSLLNDTNAMDLIFCRNVLMYFDGQRAAAVVERLGRSLVEGGTLVLGPADPAGLVPSTLTKAGYPGVMVYRKQCQRGAETAAGVGLLSDPVPAGPAPGPHWDPAPLLAPPPDAPVSGGAHAARPAPVEPSPAAVYDDSLALYRQGRYGEAVETLRALLGTPAEGRRAPGAGAEAIPLLVRAYANLGRLAEAEEWCHRAIAGDRLDAGLHYLLAVVLQERDRPADAAASLRRALYLDPRLVVAHFALGRLMHQQGRFTEARRHFTNARSLLDACPPDEVLPESEGMTAGMLLQVIAAVGGEEGVT